LASRSRLALLLLWAGPAFAGGTIDGTVSLVRLSVGSEAAGPEGALVYLEDAPAAGKPPEGPFVIEQVAKSFQPAVLVVPVGAQVDFPNKDTFFHNVFSQASGNSFDLGLYKGGASRSVVFTRPGLVPIFCNIHPQMISFILVVTNPFHTRPDEAGHFRFLDVPPGSYHLVAWFPYGSPVREEVQVEEGRTSDVQVTLRERSGALRHRNKDGKPYTHY
jgi:plastocyanin